MWSRYWVLRAILQYCPQAPVALLLLTHFPHLVTLSVEICSFLKYRNNFICIDSPRDRTRNMPCMWIQGELWRLCQLFYWRLVMHQSILIQSLNLHYPASYTFNFCTLLIENCCTNEFFVIWKRNNFICIDWTSLLVANAPTLPPFCCFVN